MSFSPSSSSTSMAMMGGSLNGIVSEKLTRENYLIWQSQVLPEIRGAQLMGFLDGSVAEPAKKIETTDKEGAKVMVPSPEYARWIAQDQQVLAYLLRNMTREVLTQLVGLTSSVAVWGKVTEMFSSQSKARVVHLRTQLNQTKREDFSSGAAYFDRIKTLSDEMATAGKPQDDDDVASYVLAGLDDEYNGFVAAIKALIKAQQSVSLGDLYSQFLAYELMR